MSLYPYIFNEMLHQLQHPTIFDQHFALGIPTTNTNSPWSTIHPRPWHNYLHVRDSGIFSVVSDKEGFKVNLDVQQFKPEELIVKIVDDFVVIEGKHEERSDEHGFISRQFSRRYKLPEDINLQALESKLSSDGVLQVFAPKVALPDAKVRHIPIKHVNEPALKQQPAAQPQTTNENKEKPAQ